MEDYLFLFISNPIAAMSIHIVKKYTFTVLVSLIFSVYIYYKQKKVGIVIIISSFIILATLIIFKIYEDYNPDIIILKHPLWKILDNYVIFGITLFLMVTNMDNIINKIKKSKMNRLLNLLPFIPK